jgi:hypothetical protein
MSLSIASLADEAARAKFARALPANAHPATDTSFADALQSGLGLSPTLLGADGAAAVVFPRRRLGLPVASLPPLATRLTVHVDPERPDGLLDIIEHLEQEYAQTSLLLGPEDRVLPPILDVRGWERQTRHTYLTDLAQLPADLAEAWSAGPRRLWRSHQNDFEIRIDERPAAEAIRHIAALQLSSYEESGGGLGLRLEEVLAVCGHLSRSGAGFPAVAYNRNGEPGAGIFVLLNTHTAVYWLAGSVRGPAMTVLLGHLLGHLRERGVVIFDWGGANVPSIPSGRPGAAFSRPPIQIWNP